MRIPSQEYYFLFLETDLSDDMFFTFVLKKKKIIQN